jgi:hypothetical protein
MSPPKGLKRFSRKFYHLFDWIKYNKLYINWSKTKFMFITSCKLNTWFETLPAEKFCLKTKSLFYRPGFIDLLGNQVEVVTEFKLLGVTLDEKLTFEPHIKLLRVKVTQKLFDIKKIFYLSYSIKLHFFKTFILPHFDYCVSLYIYISNSLLENIKGLYNTVIP